jgi:hypothetical protein
LLACCSRLPAFQASRWRRTPGNCLARRPPNATDEAEFRQVLSPEFMVKRRVGIGGPQPAEAERQLAEARSTLETDKSWMETARQNIKNADARLDSAFHQLLKQ